MEKVVEVQKSQLNQPMSPMSQLPVVNPFPNKKQMKLNQKYLLPIIGIVVALLGIGTGKILASSSTKSSTSITQTSTSSGPEIKSSDTEAGMSDVSQYADKESPEGELKTGGISGEGTHHLERTGGVSQNVYLSSTVLDLESFVGKKVKVWGQTISGKKAGWLMDVVKIKVLE